MNSFVSVGKLVNTVVSHDKVTLRYILILPLSEAPRQLCKAVVLWQRLRISRGAASRWTLVQGRSAGTEGPSMHAASPAAATAKYTVSRALSPLSSSSSYPTVWGRNTVASNHHHHQIYSAQ